VATATAQPDAGGRASAKPMTRSRPAAETRADEANRLGNVIPLKEGNSGAAVFFVHAMGGTIESYKPIVDSLPIDVAAYGVKALRPGHPLYPLRSVEAMAEAYLTEITRLGRGAIYLCGWSLGGFIAFEIARRLGALGRPPALLAIIDTTLTVDHVSAVRSADYTEWLSRKRWLTFAGICGVTIEGLTDRLCPFWSLSDAQKLETFAEHAACQNPRRYGSGDGREKLCSDFAFYMILRKASDEYRPKPCSGRAVFFTASEENDAQSGQVWEGLCKAGCDVIQCPAPIGL
jgi:thioesterase domain-containing protein